jgi:hypothetical protein
VAVVYKQHNGDEQHFELVDGAADVVVAGDDDDNTRRTFGVGEVEVAHPIVSKVDNLEEELCGGKVWHEVVHVEEPKVAAVVAEVLEVVEKRIVAAEEVGVGVEQLD